MPYLHVEPAFSQWADRKPVVHDCIVDVPDNRTPSRTESFMVSAYYDRDEYPENLALTREYPHLPPWHGEIAVVFLGSRQFFRKTARAPQIKKAVAAYVSLLIHRSVEANGQKVVSLKKRPFVLSWGCALRNL